MFSSFPLCYLKHTVILFLTKNPQFALFVSASCLSKCCLFFSAFLCDLFLNYFLSFSFFISFVVLQMEVLDKLVMPFRISLLLWEMCAIIVFGYQIPALWLCLYPFSYVFS